MSAGPAPAIRWLVAAGLLDAGAALLHLACIAGGPDWYRFFGAGRRIVREAERGLWPPALFALAIAAALGVAAAYAFSGAGLIRRLPLRRTALATVCAVYTLRALALPVMRRTMPDLTPTFLFVSSAVVLAFAIVHALGLRAMLRAR